MSRDLNSPSGRLHSEIRRPWHPVKASVALIVMLLLAACLRTTEPPPGEDKARDEFSSLPGELLIVEYTFPGHEEPSEITVQRLGGYLLFEGDIILGKDDEPGQPAELGPQGNGIIPGGFASGFPVATRWHRVGGENATPPYTYLVPFEISSSFSSQANIQAAIQHFEANTNLRFEARTDQSDYVRFVTNSVDLCASAVGRVNGVQELTLDESRPCTVGNIIHELGHAVGLVHEHQRLDRDSHIELFEGNIRAGQGHNFKLRDNAMVLGPYDYDSVMHYGNWAFGKPHPTIPGQTLLTIETKPPGISIGQRAGLSPLDIATLGRMYPERPLPVITIRAPDLATTFSEDEGVSLTADILTDVFFAQADPGLVVSWSVERVGTPGFTPTGASGSSESFDFSLCDGVYDVRAATVAPPLLAVISDTLRISVQQATSNPPPSCEYSVEVIRPGNGNVYELDSVLVLEAAIDDDHPETDEPLTDVVWWHQPGSSGIWSQIGTGLITEVSAASLGLGQHSVIARYGAAAAETVFTIVEPLDVTILVPTYGQTTFLAGTVFTADITPGASEPDYFNIRWLTRRLSSGATSEPVITEGTHQIGLDFDVCGVYEVEARLVHPEPLPGFPDATTTIHDTILVYARERPNPELPFPPPCTPTRSIVQPLIDLSYPPGAIALSAVIPPPLVPEQIPPTISWRRINPANGVAIPIAQGAETSAIFGPGEHTLHLYRNDVAIDAVRFEVTP